MTEKSSKDNFSLKSEDKLNLDDFAYQLPPELIAQNPVEKRDHSRLLFYNRENKSISHLNFRDIGSLLKSGDILVVNNTKVIPAKLSGQKESGGTIELLLTKKVPDEIGLWQAMATHTKRLKVGEIIRVQGTESTYNIIVEDIFLTEDNQKRLLVNLTKNNEDQTFTILKDAGNAPLPPYIVKSREKDLTHHYSKDKDLERYQTVFAKEPGAVAAPTAGLHFSDNLFGELKSQGITILETTLHVGPGTFKPITTDIEHHSVEAEWFSINLDVCQVINRGKKEGQRIIAVGTTTCRALESACLNGILEPQESHTSLFIKPGYKFKLIDGLITNFHLSKSSLLLLVAAFMGKDELLNAYAEAIEKRYRFYSYGDAMIIL